MVGSHFAGHGPEVRTGEVWLRQTGHIMEIYD